MPTPTPPKQIVVKQPNIAIKCVNSPRVSQQSIVDMVRQPTPIIYKSMTPPILPKVATPNFKPAKITISPILPTFFTSKFTPKVYLPFIDKNTANNVWLPPKTGNNKQMKIMTKTALGTVPIVPTVISRILHKPINVVLNIISKEEIDPILKATIYLDSTKEQDRPYNYVSERMRSITEGIISLNKQHKTEFQPLLDIVGKVNEKLFELALSIYENNQVFYQDRIDDNTIDMSLIKQGLTHLEYWFMFIAEPKPIFKDEIVSWKERESCKIEKGITSYCDPELYFYITPMSTFERSKLPNVLSTF